jgi:hypothetical protein
MPKTVQYMRRIAASHEADHELCDVGNCFEAARMAEEFRRDESEWTEHEQRLADKALMGELLKQDRDPAYYFDDVAAVRAGIAFLDEEPDFVERMRARVAIKELDLIAGRQGFDNLG